MFVYLHMKLHTCARDRCNCGAMSSSTTAPVLATRWDCGDTRTV